MNRSARLNGIACALHNLVVLSFSNARDTRPKTTLLLLLELADVYQDKAIEGMVYFYGPTKRSAGRAL